MRGLVGCLGALFLVACGSPEPAMTTPDAPDQQPTPDAAADASPAAGFGDGVKSSTSIN